MDRAATIRNLIDELADAARSFNEALRSLRQLGVTTKQYAEAKAQTILDEIEDVKAGADYLLTTIEEGDQPTPR